MPSPEMAKRPVQLQQINLLREGHLKQIGTVGYRSHVMAGWTAKAP